VRTFGWYLQETWRKDYYLWACRSFPSLISSSHRLIVSGTLNILIKLSTAAASYTHTRQRCQRPPLATHIQQRCQRPPLATHNNWN